MKIIKQLCAYYYVGLVIGYFNKGDIIRWVDSIIEKEEFPHELIDVSLSENGSIEYTASMLRKAYGGEIIIEPLYKILGKLVLELEEGRINGDRFFTYLRSLCIQGTAFVMDENLLYNVDRLTDA